VIGEHQCFVIACEGKPDCDPWDDGILHFDSEADALNWAAANGWLAVGGRHLCPNCAREADCAATGHQYGPWSEPIVRYGVAWRRRTCEHCMDTDTDPPFEELSLLMNAARQMAGEDL